jgi:Insertion element 4 transposase N-terminal
MSRATCSKPPAHVVIYLPIALCLYPDDDYEEVAEKPAGMPALMPEACWEAPTRGAITQARRRLGSEAVREVFQQVARPAATESTPGAWLGRRRVMAIDGFVVDLPDTEANVAEFGRDSAGGQETAFPQARVVAISECTSHAVMAADVAGCWAGEQTLAFSR